MNPVNITNQLANISHTTSVKPGGNIHENSSENRLYTCISNEYI